MANLRAISSLWYYEKIYYSRVYVEFGNEDHKQNSSFKRFNYNALK